MWAAGPLLVYRGYMAPRSKLLSHPDKDEIITMLTDGVPVRKIADMLEERYPKRHQAHLRISFPTLQEFKTAHLNLKNKVSSDVEKEAQRQSKEWHNTQEVKTTLENTSSYQEAITKIANSELDARKEIMKVFGLVESRLEVLYNKLNDKDKVSRGEDERLVQGYLDQLMKVLDQYKKYIDGFKETTEHNVNITIAADQVNLLRDVVRETLAECDPQLAVKFMDKISTRMKQLVFTTGNPNHEVFINRALSPHTDNIIDILNDSEEDDVQ